MKVHQALICLFFFTLQAGNIGVLARPRTVKGIEGESTTFACTFMIDRDKRFLCKQECEDVLIKTTDDRDENGRYSIEYSKTFYMSYPMLYVTITRLSKSDAGRYRCGLGEPLFPDSKQDIELIVEDGPTASVPNYTSRPFSTSSASPEITEQTERATARLGSAPSTPKPNWTLQTFPTSASTTTTTQHLSSISVSFTSSSSSSESTEQSEQKWFERATAQLGSWNLLYVGFFLLIMMTVLLVFGLLFRAIRRKKSLVKAEYTLGRYIEQNGDDNRAAGPQNQVTEDLSGTVLLHSAPAGNSSNVNYSVL